MKHSLDFEVKSMIHNFFKIVQFVQPQNSSCVSIPQSGYKHKKLFSSEIMTMMTTMMVVAVGLGMMMMMIICDDDVNWRCMMCNVGCWYISAAAAAADDGDGGSGDGGGRGGGDDD